MKAIVVEISNNSSNRARTSELFIIAWLVFITYSTFYIFVFIPCFAKDIIDRARSYRVIFKPLPDFYDISRRGFAEYWGRVVKKFSGNLFGGTNNGVMESSFQHKIFLMSYFDPTKNGTLFFQRPNSRLFSQWKVMECRSHKHVSRKKYITNVS